MKCSCCGRKKKMFESFEDIGQGGNICVDCSDILYRIHDAVTENQKEEYEAKVYSVKDYIKAKKSTNEFESWFYDDFIKRNTFIEKN